MVEEIHLPKSHVLRFFLANGLEAVVRPSGTEPKLKIYYSVKAPSEADAEKALIACKASVKQLLESVKK